MANRIAEGYGRYHYREDIRFLFYARGSAKESAFWLRRVQNRNLMAPEKCQQFIERLACLEPQLNAYINSIRRKVDVAKGE